MNEKLNTDPFPIIQSAGIIKDKQESLTAEFGTYFQIFFLAAAGWGWIVYGKTEALNTFSIIFSAIILEAFPFMLMGALLGGFVEVFLSREQLIRILPKNPIKAIIMQHSWGSVFLCVNVPSSLWSENFSKKECLWVQRSHFCLAAPSLIPWFSPLPLLPIPFPGMCL